MNKSSPLIDANTFTTSEETGISVKQNKPPYLKYANINKDRWIETISGREPAKKGDKLIIYPNNAMALYSPDEFKERFNVKMPAKSGLDDFPGVPGEPGIVMASRALYPDAKVVEMTADFKLDMDDGITRMGKKGDFLLEDASGARRIVPKGDLNSEVRFLSEPSLNKQRVSAPMLG